MATSTKSIYQSGQMSCSPTKPMDHNNVKQSKIKEVDDYFCSLINLIHPDVYFAKLKQDINFKSSEVNRGNITPASSSGNAKQNDPWKINKTKLFRKSDGRVMTVTEVYDELPAEEKKNTLGNKSTFVSREENRAQVAEKLHTKIEDSQKSRKRKIGRSDDPGKSRMSKKQKKMERKSKSKQRSLEDKLSRRKARVIDSDTVCDETVLPAPTTKISFSKFNVTSSVGVGQDEGKQKKKHKKLGGKSKYEKLIKEAERKKEKLEELKKKKDGNANEVEEKGQWKSALLKAQGVKVKDDITLLKKAAKLRDKQKEKSQKEWDKRVTEQKERLEGKQKKRKENLRKRNEEKLKKKKKRDVKKGRIFAS